MDATVLHEIKRNFSDGQKEFKHGDFEAALALFTAAFDKFRDAGNSEGMAETLYQIGMTQQKLGRFNDAIISLKEALELYKFLKKQEREVIALHAIGMVHAEVGSADEIATKYLEDALVIYKDKEYAPGIAGIHFELGNIAFKGGDLVEARRYYGEAETLIKGMDGLPGMGKVYYMLALLDLMEGNVDDCMAKLDEASALFQTNSDIDGQVRVLSVEGLVALRKGNTREAEDAFNECTRLVAEGYMREPEKTGVLDKQQEVQLLLYMGTLLFHDTKYNLPDIGKTLYLRAYKYFEEAVALAEKIQYKNGICLGLFNIGMILVDRGDKHSIAESIPVLTRVLDIAKDVKNNELIVKSLLFLGIANRYLDMYDQALNFLQDCAIISKRLKYSLLEARALMEKTRITIAFGRLDDALSILVQARAIVSADQALARLDYEILVLQAEIHQGTGALDKATEALLQARDECIHFNDKKGLVKVLHEVARLDERQGFIPHAVSCIAEVESIHKASNQFTELSRARVERARLTFMMGDADKAMAMLRDEITFIRDTGIPDGDAITASAKFSLFKILKSKNEIIESDDIFRDLLAYYSQSNQLVEMFDVIIEIAYDALENGNIVSLKHAMEKTWKIINQSRESIQSNERLVYFLHVYGLMYQYEGTANGLDLAQKYLGECLSIAQKMNMDDMKAVIVAQIADIAVIEGKSDALALFIDALKQFTDAGNMQDAVRVHAQLAWIHYMDKKLDEALAHALRAVQLLEDHIIARPPHDMVHDIKEKFHYYTRPVDVHQLLASMYVEKFTMENDFIALERALIAVEFQKLYAVNKQYYAKHMFAMLSCPKLEKYIEQDEQLCKEAVMAQKTITFLLDCKTFHERVLASPDSHKEFSKRTIDYIKGKIKEARAALAATVSNVKLTRAYLMECIDPGSLLPFIGFNVVKQAQKQLAKFSGIAVLDYAILPDIAKIAIFLLHAEGIELVLRDATGEFFALIDRLRETRAEEDPAEILFLHRQLTAWLFPAQLRERLAQLGVKYPFICPDARLGDVLFAMLGEDNGLAIAFTPVYVSHMIDFKAVMRDGIDARGAGNQDFYLLFPDPDDAISNEERDGLGYFFDCRPAATAGARKLYTMVAGPPATYKDVLEIENINPNVVHYSGSSFFPGSLPFKGHLNMNDRSFFLEDFMGLDLANKHALLCISSTDEVPTDINQLLVVWRTLRLSNIPNFLHVSSRQGFSGRFFIYFYDRLLRGETLGEAYHHTVRYFASAQEISPISRCSHVLIANPFWRLAGQLPGENSSEN